jgi:hypothetical protein
VPAAGVPGAAWNVPFYFGGTSLLIIVVVTMDFMAQVQSYVMSQQYESLLKKANFKGNLTLRYKQGGTAQVWQKTTSSRCRGGPGKPPQRDVPRQA